jgi:hypothetical protein
MSAISIVLAPPKAVGNVAGKAYVAVESLIQAAYDKVPDKAQLATHPAGIIAGSVVGTIATIEAGKKSLEWMGQVPDQFAKHYNAGDTTTAFIESGGKTLGAVAAGGFTLLIVGATVANVDAAVRSFLDKPSRG